MENNTILVIDDDRNILAIIELYLKKAGFQVFTCADGTSAMAAFHETRPSLVVLDIMLPGRDGWAVLHDIRMESETPVIMLTAKGDTGDRVQGLELGADDYIAKPFDAKELIARIKAVLRRSTPSEPERTISLPGLTVSLENYAVALHDFGEAIGIIVQRFRQFAHFVAGEIRRQRLRCGTGAAAPQPAREFGHRRHHPRCRPPSQRQRQGHENEHR